MALAFYKRSWMKTNVYIDGFNFYYGCLKGTPHRWLDLAAFCQASFPPPRNQINRIRYFTAHVNARPNHPSNASGSLAEPIRLVRQKFRKKVLVLHPCGPGRAMSVELRRVASKSRGRGHRAAACLSVPGDAHRCPWNHP